MRNPTNPHNTLVKILDRAEKLGIKFKRTSLIMDLDSLRELDLPRLEQFPDFDFAHDICGIMRHMDRSSWPGKLTGCFSPRCTRHEKAA